MPDEPDPPRKIYGLKPREDFERANGPTSQPSENPTDVASLFKSASDPRAVKINSPVNRPNEVHGILQQNLAHDRAAGWYEVSTRPNLKRRRRIWGFWVAITLVDGPLGFMMWKLSSQVRGDQTAAINFIFLAAGAGVFTSVLTWKTWFLRTED